MVIIVLMAVFLEVGGGQGLVNRIGMEELANKTRPEGKIEKNFHLFSAGLINAHLLRDRPVILSPKNFFCSSYSTRFAYFLTRTRFSIVVFNIK